MADLRVFVDGVGLLGPGLPDWTAGKAIFAGATPYVRLPAQIPPAATLPPAERRRVGRVVKLALAVGYEAAGAAGQDPATLSTVFTASGGDGETCHEICQVLATADRQISPTRFHNSVHNAPSGYWSIATGAMAPSTSLGAFDGSFGAGLLEAACQVSVARTPVLLIAYDTGYPEPLHRARPIDDAFAMAFLLSPVAGKFTLAALEVSLTTAIAGVMPEPELETLRRSYPAARGLPLLVALARRNTLHEVIEYLGHCRLQVSLTPCL